jgi:hypothetical protein
MIPPLDDGVLPEGIHDCNIQEVATVFGRFQRSDRRIRLTQRLEEYLKEAKASGILLAVVIDGSYVSAKDEPEDIDLLAVLRSDLDPAKELKPFQYNVISKSAVRAAKYPFDLFAVPEGRNGIMN